MMTDFTVPQRTLEPRMVRRPDRSFILAHEVYVQVRAATWNLPPQVAVGIEPIRLADGRWLVSRPPL